MGTNLEDLGWVGCTILVVLVLALSAFGAWLIMLMWNWLIPNITGWTEIGFWQAYGISILASFLTGGFTRGASSKLGDI